MRPRVVLCRRRLPDGVGWRRWARGEVARGELYTRTPFSARALERLGQARVVIFGVGSGGGKLAIHLAQAGVGRLRLIDPARVGLANCIRHAASVRDVGRWKVEAVADLVLLHNPTVEVEVYPCDPFAPGGPLSPEGFFRAADLVVAATDRTASQLAVNAWAWRLGIPAVFGGCYQGARGGEVLFTLPGEGTPCLACLRGGLAGPEQEGPFDYSAARSPEDFEAEPGLSAAIDLVTDVEAQVALGILLRGTDSPLAELIDPGRNFLLVGGALAGGFYRFRRPFHIFWQPLKGPRPDCDVCGPQGAAPADPLAGIPKGVPAGFDTAG